MTTEDPLQLSTFKTLRNMFLVDEGKPASASTDDLLKEPVEVLDEAVRHVEFDKRQIEAAEDFDSAERKAEWGVANDAYLRLLKVLGLKISSLDKFQHLGIKNDDEKSEEDETSTLVAPPLRVQAPGLSYGDVWKARVKANDDEKLIAAVMYVVRMTPKLAVGMQTNNPKSLISYLKNEMKIKQGFVTTFTHVNSEYLFALKIGNTIVLEGKSKTSNKTESEVEAWKKFFHMVIVHDYISVVDVKQRLGEC